MTRPIPPQGVQLIKDFESCELRAYQDVKGVWTIGWGNTRHARKGLTIPQSTADRWLKEDLAIAADEIARVLKPNILAALSDDQYGALASFAFNLGVKPKQHQIWALINSGQFDRVPARLLLYNKASINGKPTTVAGLTRRRRAEAAMWQDDGEDIILTAYAADVTPTPRGKPPRKSWTVWGAISAPFLYIASQVRDLYETVKDWLTPDTVKQGIAAITPYAQQSELVQHALTALATLAAVLVAWGVLQKQRESRS